MAGSAAHKRGAPNVRRSRPAVHRPQQDAAIRESANRPLLQLRRGLPGRGQARDASTDRRRVEGAQDTRCAQGLRVLGQDTSEAQGQAATDRLVTLHREAERDPETTIKAEIAKIAED